MNKSLIGIFIAAFTFTSGLILVGTLSSVNETASPAPAVESLYTAARRITPCYGNISVGPDVGTHF